MQNASERLARMEAVFHEVLEVGPELRATRLQELCGEDTRLLAEVRKLLRAAERERSTSGAKRDQQRLDEAEFAQRSIGPYKLQSLLGRGGTGAVYLAQRADGQYEKTVAIKVIDVPLATELFRDRFRRERQILAGLDHPLIARLLDGGVSEEGSPYLVMDYVAGVPIDQYCTQRALPIEERLHLFQRVCEAVQFAHQNLVVHRDLKPDNILVSDDGTPHLLDFGTAKLLSPEDAALASQSTRDGFLSFTPQYASPEQVLGQPVTIGSDVYSLGALLFVLLTGRQPYQLADFSTGEMLRVIVNLPPARPSAGDMPYGRIDADLDSIVLKALRKRPQERYATIQQFSADVQAFLEHRPVEARRGSMRYQAAKFVRRNRIALLASSLLLLTLLAGVGGVYWQARVSNLERRRAEARSADLRELSNSLLSELDEALKDIPGTTGAQTLLVTRVLDHLDRMAHDANGDRETTLDLIHAYTNLGNVQSNTYYQNLGDAPGALASFDKALALASGLAASHPQDREVLRSYAAALQARGETLSNAGDAQASAESLKAAVRVYDQVVQLPGVTTALIFEAAIAYEVLGNESGEDAGLGDPAAAAIAYRRAIDMDNLALHMDPNFMPVRRGLPIMHMHIGNLVLETDPAKARSEFQTAQQLFDALPAEQRQKRAQIRFGALLVRKIAAADAELGQYDLAAPLFSQALATYQHLSDTDVKDVGALADLYRVLNDQATSYEYAADPLLAEHAGQGPEVRRRNLQAAAASLQQCAATIHRIFEIAPSQEEWKPTLAKVELRLNAAHIGLGLPPLSVAEISSAVAETVKAAEGPHSAASDIDDAVNALLLTKVAALRNPSLAVQLAERGVALTHQQEASYMLLLARAQRDNQQTAAAAATATRGLKLLADLVSGQTSFRLRRLLENQLRLD
ncbi:MAG: serine/threonine-protein kinase [Granulicella sp.]